MGEKPFFPAMSSLPNNSADALPNPLPAPPRMANLHAWQNPKTARIGERASPVAAGRDAMRFPRLLKAELAMAILADAAVRPRRKQPACAAGTIACKMRTTAGCTAATLVLLPPPSARWDRASSR